MLAFIALFFPAAIMVVWKRRLFKEDYDWKAMLMEYIAGVVLINFLVIAIAYLFFESEGSIVNKINNYSNYAFRYIFLASVFAITLPWCWLNRKKLKFSVKTEGFSKPVKPKHINVLLYLYAAGLFVVNLTRCFDNVVWGDEAWSILLVRNSLTEILSTTAVDVHPPLYYIWLKLFEVLFDGAGWHIPTFITYSVILIIGVTWVREHFGFGGSALFITLCSFLDSAVRYNVEIRMYSMAEMFVLLSFISLYNILRDHKWKDYFLFAAFSLGAAYSHYYALFTVAFFYLFLLIYNICRKSEIKKILVTCVMTVLGYLPWLIVFIKALAKKVTDDYWMSSIPTWEECFDYLFSGELNDILLRVYFLLIIIVIVAEILGIRKGCLKIETVQPLSENEIGPCSNHLFHNLISDKNCEIETSLELRKNKLSYFSWWIIAGQIGLIGTMALGLGFSNAVRPVFAVRYLFPAAVISWIVLAACISRLKWKNIIALILTVVIIVNYAPSFLNTYNAEKNYDDQIETILEETSEIGKDSFIYTNYSHFYWTMLDYYYPGTSHNRVVGAHDIYPIDTAVYYWNEETPTISDIEDYDFGSEFWLFWKTKLTDEELKIVEDAGYDTEFICEGRMSSSYYVYIYHLTK